MVNLEIHQGGIFDVEADAIVNAANKELQPGGGVCGLIYKRAGHRLTAWSEGIAQCGKLTSGAALVSPSYDLQARYEWIIHTVAPDMRVLVEHSEVETALAIGSVLMVSAWHATFSIADALGLETIVMPSIGTGIYGWPHEIAAQTLEASLNHPWPGTAILAIYNPDDVPHYERLVR